jgi:hypothetical protein
VLSALSPTPDQYPVDEQPGYMNALHQDIQGLADFPSFSKESKTALRGPHTKPVSNGVPNETKLHDIPTIYLTCPFYKQYFRNVTLRFTKNLH